MPGKLIYRCGRFLDQGYVTLIGGDVQGALDKATDDAIWQTLREGKPVAGSVGHVWTVLSEGRDVTDVLAFVHGVKLPAAVEVQIKARLHRLAEIDLPAALAQAQQENLAPTKARGMLNDLLNRAAAELSALVLTAPPLASSSLAKKEPREKKGIVWATALGILVLVGIASVTFWPNRNDSADAAQGPSRKEVLKVAKACYPGLTEEGPELDRLVQALGPVNWREDDSVVRDYLRALPDRLLDQVPQPEIEAVVLCDKRRKMWEKAGTLRGGLDDALGMLEAAQIALGSDKHDLRALRLMVDTHKFLRENPIPEPPGDCAADNCLPLINAADVKLKGWVNALSGELARSLDASVGDVAARLRSGEVELRGELSLAGAPQVADLFRLFAPLWSCGREPTCDLPLRDATDWLTLL